MSEKMSSDALRRADEFFDEMLFEADEHHAPCLRDDLEDNREWFRLKLAALIDEVADGRPLYARP